MHGQPGPAAPVPRGWRRHELDRLVARHVLSAEQAEQVGRALRLGSDGGPDRVRWPEIAGYVGGGLVLAGAVLLVATSWNRLSDVARSGLAGLVTAVLLVGGVVAAGGLTRLVRGPRDVRTARLRIGATLLTLAAGTLAVTVGVALPDQPGVGAVAIGAACGVVLAAAGYWLLPTVFGLVAAIALEIVTALSTVNSLAGMTSVQTMAALVISGMVVVTLAAGGVLRHRQVGLALGLLVVVVGLQQLLGAHPMLAYSCTFLFAVGCLAAYRWWRTWVLLVVGILGLTLAVPEAVWDLTGGAVGGAAIPLIGGVILLVTSALGLRLRRHGAPP